MNLKTSVIATDIANLTDARYFAAWGVDYMAYVIEELHPQFIGAEGIREIIDWVEGPASLGQLSGISISDSAATLYQDLELSGVICSPFTDAEQVYTISQKVWREVVELQQLSTMTEEVVILKLAPDVHLAAAIPTIKAAALTNEIYIDGLASVADLETVLQEANPAGIVLRGGEEEKVGYKSYDELDEFFEWLEVD